MRQSEQQQEVKCIDCGSENLKQKPHPENPKVAQQWCEDCGEVQ
ncbi:MAG: hypothetical protein ABEI86_10320 [Halobacteriaceae archaeon]